MTTITTPPSHRIWIDDDVLYNEFQGEFNFELALEVEKRSLSLLQEHHLDILPLIIILKDIDEFHFKLPLADYGKMVSSFELINHVSGLLIVGATEKIKNTIEPMNKVFFHGKVHFVDSIEQAKEQAAALYASKNTLLDK